VVEIDWKLIRIMNIRNKAICMNPEDFLHRVYGRIDGFRQAQKIYASKLAPDFSVFNFIAPDEMRLSKIIASLIDPLDSHAQEMSFLNAFLKRFTLENYLPVTTGAKVSTEVVTNQIDNSMRRMDILIDFGQSAIVIENKPWAADGYRQVKDYLKQLKNSHPHMHCLLYLSGNGKLPSGESIAEAEMERLIKEKRLLIIAYPQLLDWLSDCRAICHSERVRAFLDDFSYYIQSQFVGVQDMEFDQIFDAVTESSEMLQTALQVAYSTNEVKQKLLNKLRTQLEEKAKKKGWRLEWPIEPIDYWSRYSGFDIYFYNKEQKYYVGFEFGGVECQGLYYGIVKKEEKLPDLPEIRDCLNNNIGFGKTSDLWPWYLNFPEPYISWRTSTTPWMEIIGECKLADMIIQKADAIYKSLAEKNLLERL
jgi:hypothetical protein